MTVNNSPTDVQATRDTPYLPWQLNTQKLHALPSEQQGLFLLTHTADLERHILDFSTEDVSRQQKELKGELFKIIQLKSPYPNRVVREILGRCLQNMLQKGARNSLAAYSNDLIALVSAGKELESKTRHAATYCLGILFEIAGSSLGNHVQTAVGALIKALKPSSNDAGSRAAIYTALARIVKDTPLDEDTARTIWKQARNTGAGDRSYAVQISACLCLTNLVHQTGLFDNANDVDKLQNATLKLMDSPSRTVRHAAAQVLSTSLTKAWLLRHATGPVVEARAKPTDDDEIADGAVKTTQTSPATSIFDIMKGFGILYTRPGIANRARATLFISLLDFTRSLSAIEVEQNYEELASYLLSNLLEHAFVQANHYRYLITRKFVRTILIQAVASRLTEAAQLTTCRFLLKLINAEANRKHKAALTSATEVLSSTIVLLGNATSSLASECRDAFLSLLEHPSFAVQTQACLAIRRLTVACPQEIIPTMAACREKLRTELLVLETSPASGRRAVSHATALCSLISATVSDPLYGDAQTYADIMSEATSLLKAAGSSELRISASQVQVAWTLINGLMPLGPSFVKVHLPQLLLIWKNTLAATTRENMRQRSLLELCYLCHVRECALTALRSFLSCNARLVTVEVSRRIGTALESSIAFLQQLPEKKVSEDPATRLSSAFQLSDHEIMAKRRVYQCFALLLVNSPAGSPDLSSHSMILSSALTAISSPDYVLPRSLSGTIASSMGVDDIWTAGDEFGCGITSLVTPNGYRNPVSQETHRLWVAKNDVQDTIDTVASSPVCSAAEYDSADCYKDSGDRCPAATELVDAAIATFALSVPVQMPKVQHSLIEQIISTLSSTALVKDTGRGSAVSINVALAIVSLLRVVSSPVPGFKYPRSGLHAEQALQDVLRILLVDREDIVRVIAGSSLGMLCNLIGSDFTAAQVNWLTDCIVNNREPEARAGCSFALASIHAQLGSMAAGLHIRQIVGILSSLAADTHPLVHFWALESLTRVADSAGLNYSACVNSTVGILSQLYISDNHNPETALLASSNMLVDRPVVAGVARGISSLIDVLGPDLQDLHKTRDMITTLVNLFKHESQTLVVVASLKCEAALSMFMPNQFEQLPYVQTLQKCLSVEAFDIRSTALDGLRNLMRRDAELVVEMASTGFEDKLWDLLDDQQHTIAVQNILQNRLQQTALDQPQAWIDRLGRILTRTKGEVVELKQVVENVDLQDEDVAGLAANGEPAKDESLGAAAAKEFLPWQVRLFALTSLQTLVDLITKDTETHGETLGLAVLQARVGDLVRIAFSASTAAVIELRIVGLKIIEQVLNLFGRTPDPDFSEAMLLEQYQAQISSALTPAFAADTTPVLAAEAINVCATFISTGIVTDLERMGRILKVLIAAFEGASSTINKTVIGDLKTYSKNAQTMFRIAVFAAWAELQVSSTEQKYLVAVVEPYISQMVPLWLESLKEYARLRYEPDISAIDNGATSIDDVYASFNRQSLLTYYQNAWLSLVNAIASLIDEDSQIVFDALDGKTSGSEQTVSKSTGINYRDEPVAFFFVLFGLTIEAIATYQSDTDANKVNLLQALRKILRPSVAGSVIYQDAIFAEAIDLLDRLALTNSIGVQAVIVEIATDLCMSHPSSRVDGDHGDTLSEDIEQLFELTRIIVLVLGDIVPGISETPGSARAKQSEEANALVHTALQSLVNVSDIFPAIIRTDLRDAILHIFIVMLSTGSCQAVMVPQSLPMFRRLVASMANQPLPHTDRQLANALARLLETLSKAQEQDSEVSLACQKNVLLACALLVTAAPDLLADDRWIVQQFLADVQASLLQPDTTRVAVGCLRTLLFAGVALQKLFEAGLKFMFEEDKELRDGQTLMANVLTMYASRASSVQRANVVQITFLALVHWAQRSGGSVDDDAAGRIVELSQLDAEAFKLAFASITPDQKRLLQSLMKSRLGSGRSNAVEHEPTIALKFNFGK